MGLLEDRLAGGKLLHAILARSVAELWGLDSNAEGIRRLERAGFDRLFVGSAEDPPPEIPEGYFDVVVAGEVIEHVRNPGLFIDAAARLIGPQGILVITTPNALRFYNPLPALLGRELVHPEHLSWYSPHTLRKTVEAGPFAVQDLYLYANVPFAKLEGVTNPIQWSARALYNLSVAALHPICIRLFPYLSDGLILVGRPHPPR